MTLYDIMVRDGARIFRWRSYLPLFFIGPLLLAFKEAAHMERVMGEFAEDLWVLMCFLLSLAGLALRAYTVGYVPSGTSGRNAKEQRATRLNTTGMYSVVRNPLYLGNFIILLGVVLSLKVWWLVLIVTMAFFVYMERIILTEEKFLTESFGEVYLAWCRKTPVIIPNLSLWKKPDMPFSLKTVLKREYQGFLGIGTAFFVTEFIVDLYFEGQPFHEWVVEDIAWPAIYALIVAISLTLRYLKKNTRFLTVDGR